MQRGRHQVQPRRQRRKLDSAKVSVALKLAQPGGSIGGLQMMLPHPDPVVEPLQRKVQIVVHLLLDHRQPPVRRHAQQVEQPMIAGARNRRHLRVHMLRIEARNHAALIRLWL
jgi:hypothetical protein